MQGIYNYIPETNNVSRVYSVAGAPVFRMCPTCNVISHVKNVLYFYSSLLLLTYANSIDSGTNIFNESSVSVNVIVQYLIFTT